MSSGASAGRPGGPGRGLGPQVTSTHQAGRGDTRSPPGLRASPGRGRLCNRVGPGRAPMDSAPREAPWGAPWPLLWAVPEPRSFGTRPGCTWASGSPPTGMRPDPPEALFPERSPGPGRGWGRGLQPPWAGDGEPPPVSAQGLGARAAALRRPRLHSSRASPLQRRTWRALGAAWQLLGPWPQHLWGASPHVWPSAPGAAPEPAQVGARGCAGASWAGTQPVGVGWGGAPSWPPAWPEQLGPDGRKGGCPQLPQAGAGLGRNATAHEGLLGTPPPSPGCGRGRACGAPPAWPGPGGARSRPTVAGSEDRHRERETC